MNYWLIKSEPNTYSWNQFLKDKKTGWDGVRNYAARNNLKAMAKGDQAFWYHSNEGLEIVGIAEVIKEYYQDPTSTDSNWVSVDFKPIYTLENPVNLKLIKQQKELQEMALVKISRLSVQPVTPEQWKVILKLSTKNYE